MENILQNSNQKQVDITILLPGKVDVKKKFISQRKENSLKCLPS